MLRPASEHQNATEDSRQFKVGIFCAEIIECNVKTRLLNLADQIRDVDSPTSQTLSVTSISRRLGDTLYFWQISVRCS